MNMTMMSIKGRKALWGLLLLPVILLIFFIYSGELGTSETSQPTLQTVRSMDGWGYQISLNKKILINQPTIPAIDTVMAFPTEKAAAAVGKIVLKKVKNHKNFTVTKDEVEHTLSLF